MQSLLEPARALRAFVLRTLRALALLGVALGAVDAHAAVSIQVTTTADQYGTNLFACSLREALHAMTIQANFGGCGLSNGALTNTIIVPAGVYTLTLPRVQNDPAAGGPLHVSAAMSIAGAGASATIIDAGSVDRVLDVGHGSGTVSISGLTVRNGTAIPGDQTNLFGAGIRVVSTGGAFAMSNVVVSGNGYAGDPSVAAVYIQQAAFSIVDSAIVNNAAIGLELYDTQAGKVQNVTISGNVSAGSAAGLEATQLSATTLIINSTIAYNHAQDLNLDPRAAGGIQASQALIQLTNSIVARNSTGDRAGGADCNAFLTSLGYNVIEDARGCTILGSPSGDITGIDPHLAPLFDYGAGIPTHLLLPGSAALGAGNPAQPGSGGNACAAADARGADRTGTGHCDAGAYQYRADFTVDTTLDADDANAGDGGCASSLPGTPCTLRAAVEEAVAGTKFRTIRVPAGHYLLSAGANPLALAASHAVTLVGDGADRTRVQQLQNAVVAVTSQHGVSLHGVQLSGAQGGVIVQSDELLLDAVRVSDSASLPGILQLECCASDLLMVGSTVDHNAASVVFGGGGMYVGSGSTARILNSTFVANSTAHDGGAIYNHGGSVSIAFSTIAGNSAAGSGAGDGGGGGLARGGSGSFFVGNSIIAGNRDTSGQGPDCSAIVQLTQWMLLSDVTGCVVGGQAAKLIGGVDPQLSSLTTQGGRTPTLGLSATSPAHGVIAQAGDCVDTNGSAALTDQRGTARPTGNYGFGNASICDLGAFQGVSDVIFADGFE